MMKQYPMTSVPNLQGFPENGYPVSAYYGIDSTLADMSSMSASASATGGNQSLAPVPQGSMRTLIVAFVAVIGAVALWHWYNK